MSRPQRVLEPNRLLKRTGHFWESHYRSTSFPEHEQQRALNALRQIHAHPKTAGMRKGYFCAPTATTAFTTASALAD
ncbi:MAG: hypothetical protein Q8M77_17245 [Hydrogenophaga sp.]|nr:hypothetical protein [Hydrogenophaga sp.]